MKVVKKELDETDRRIITLFGQGFTAKRIAYDLNISQKNIEYRIWQMKKYYECDSVAQLLLKLASIEHS